MKTHRYYILICTLILSLTISAQGACDAVMEREFTKLENLIESQASQADIDKKVGRIKRSIKRCEMQSRESQDHLTTKLNEILKNSGAVIPETQTQRDLSKISYAIGKMSECVVKQGTGCIKEEYKIVTRDDILYMQNYKDDGSSFYNSEISFGLGRIKDLEVKVNNDDWVRRSKIMIDDKAKSINEDLKSKYMNCFYNDLSYISEVALPSNANIEEIKDYLKKHL